ncbi:hypothetical protein [Burkholderia sp. LMG 21824]|uniref:hypothetical protein n=1 Tax=Burkholderia sp. LMG 21824 TaxID=3158172 RepID=UPI003C3026B9
MSNDYQKTPNMTHATISCLHRISATTAFGPMRHRWLPDNAAPDDYYPSLLDISTGSASNPNNLRQVILNRAHSKVNRKDSPMPAFHHKQSNTQLAIHEDDLTRHVGNPAAIFIAML